jgi:hypothetical protein
MDIVYEHGTEGMEDKAVASRSRIFYMAKTTTDNETTEVKKTSKLTPAWERTNDVQGHKPKFTVMCGRCAQSLDSESKMQVRHSVLRLSIDAQKEIYFKEYPPEEPWEPDQKALDIEVDLNVMAYKCPHCAWFIKFYVQDDMEYIQDVFKKRGYQAKFIPLWETDELSDEELKSVERQLQALGYWAGR